MSAKRTTINHIFVCSIAWAFIDVLGSVFGAVGALIMEGTGLKIISEFQKRYHGFETQDVPLIS